MLALACIWLASSCSKRNEDVCCDTDAECTAIGFSSHQPCDLGVCVNYACTTEHGACDDDHDCTGVTASDGTATAFCVAGTCAACATSASCPARAPVCDDAVHSCRICAKDAECDSGACDLAAGTCVDSANILYASPTGSQAAPCTQAAPCSLSHASELTDTTRTYIVMLPGEHSGGSVYFHGEVVVAGSNSTFAINEQLEEIGSQVDGKVTIRDLKIVERLKTKTDNEPAAIDCNGCKPQALTLDNVTISTNLISPFNADNIILRNCTFTQPIGAYHLIADGTMVVGDVSIGSPSTITNSVILGGLEIGYNSSNYGEVTLTNDTFVGGQITCSSPQTGITFYNSILFSLSGFDTSTCINTHNNNITYPTPYLGAGELTADPLFTDPSMQIFRLQPQSPAIDAADPATATDHDLDGVRRPQNGKPDIGAFEYVPSSQ